MNPCENCAGTGVVLVEIEKGNSEIVEVPTVCPICSILDWEWDEHAGVWTCDMEEDGRRLEAYVDDGRPNVVILQWDRRSGWTLLEDVTLGRHETDEAAKAAVAAWVDGSSPLW